MLRIYKILDKNKIVIQQTLILLCAKKKKKKKERTEKQVHSMQAKVIYKKSHF